MTKKTKPGPKIIEFTFARYSYFPCNEGDKLILEGNKITFERHWGCEDDLNLVISNISDRKWEEFLRSLDRLKIWNWSKNYRDPVVLDGGGWNLFIKTTSSKIESHGINKKPSNFNEFLESINKLMGIEAFEIFYLE
jgi:hypothetical protein